MYTVFATGSQTLHCCCYNNGASRFVHSYCVLHLPMAYVGLALGLTIRDTLQDSVKFVVCWCSATLLSDKAPCSGYRWFCFKTQCSVLAFHIPSNTCCHVMYTYLYWNLPRLCDLRLKAQQGLLVDFHSFPQKFIDLLKLCITESSLDSPK